MLEQNRTYGLIKLSYPDGGPAGYFRGVDEDGRRYVCAYSDTELAETNLRLNGLGYEVARVGRVVEWPGAMIDGLAEQSPDYDYVRLDPPLTGSQQALEIVETQRHARHLEVRLDELEARLGVILVRLADADTPEKRREAVLDAMTDTMRAHWSRHND